MPGNVTTYTPTAVFPQIFAQQLMYTTEWATRESLYPDGTSQRASIPGGTPAKARRRFHALLKLAGPSLLGTVNTSATAVVWVSGDKFTAGMVGRRIRIGTTRYLVDTFTDDENIVIHTSAGTQTGVAYGALSRVDDLIGFYTDRQGTLIPFWVYYPYETVPMGSYDPTGTETVGRYTVRFDCPLKIEWQFPRGTVELELVEVT